MGIKNEDAYETEICEYLKAHGWYYSPNDTDYDRELALFPDDVRDWLQDTQPEQFRKIVDPTASAEVQEKEFARLLKRLADVLDKPLENQGGTLAVIRDGFKVTPAAFRMAQPRPADNLNPTTLADYSKNRLRVMRQVSYSLNNRNRIDLVLFLNGLPVATLELKTFFNQSVQDAMLQYKTDRLPVDAATKKREPLLSFGQRALVHFAVAEDEVFMTTNLQGPQTRFLPFNRGNDNHKGNSPNPNGAATAYLWEEVFARDAWMDLLTRFMHLNLTTSIDPLTSKKTVSKTLLFPRYQQWDAVTKMVTAARADGPGHRYLIQHSAGSGKTNTIAWTAHRLSSLHTPDGHKVFDTVIVISDRKVLDGQLRDAVRAFEKTEGVFESITPGSGAKSAALSKALLAGKQIIGVTLQTFPFALEAIREEHGLRGRTFAVIADEAHSSQAGEASAKLKQVLMNEGRPDDDVSVEDVLLAEMAEKASSERISFFAFTATPKAKTLELFGTKNPATGLAEPFHLYSMQQAIEEEFILDVLQNYTPYKTAFKLAHNGRDYDSEDATVEKTEAVKELMRWVKLHPHSIAQKVAIIVEHFRSNVQKELAGRAKAMVVTDSRKSAVRYKIAIDKYIKDHGYTGLGTLVAFSGDVKDEENTVHSPGLDGVFNETNLNPRLAGADLAEAFKGEDYKIMLVANKFQTGFDQPLLCAMYVDKRLSGITAVQTLSRLNRKTEGKGKTFVIDFVNDPAEILEAFQTYYTEAALVEPTDPDMIHDLQAKLDAAGIYEASEVNQTALVWVQTKGANKAHSQLVAALTPAKERFEVQYRDAQDSGDTVATDRLDLFRKDMGTFIRAYDFLAQIIDYQDTDLAKRAIYYKLLLPIINEENRGRTRIDLTDVVMTHQKITRQEQADLRLSGDEAGGLKPMTAAGSGLAHEAEKARWDEIINQVNQAFEGSGLDDRDQVSVLETVLKAAGDNETLTGQAEANGKTDFYTSPLLLGLLADAIFGAGEVHSKGIEWLLAKVSPDDQLELFKQAGLWERLRGEPDAA